MIFYLLLASELQESKMPPTLTVRVFFSFGSRQDLNDKVTFFFEQFHRNEIFEIQVSHSKGEKDMGSLALADEAGIINESALVRVSQINPMHLLSSQSSARGT